MNNRPLISACLAMLVCGCTVGPDFKEPHGIDQSAWQDAGQSVHVVSPQSEPDPNWWSGFNDPVLSSLIEKAVAGNLDLQQAMLRVIEAREGVKFAESAGLPSVGANASYAREQMGLKGILESRGVFNQLDSLASNAGPGSARDIANGVNGALHGATDPVNLYQYGLDASWELDLFGRVRRSVEQAQAQTEAQAEALGDALVVLESEVAQDYIQLRRAQALKASQEENVKAAQASLDLTSRRHAQGLATELDVNEAQTQLDDAQRQLPSYDKQAQIAMNALSVLTGQPPGTLDSLLRPSTAMPQLPAVVNVGIPSSLARRRPDIREAEAQLHAATAGIGVAVANFYPDISLTGNVGFRATDTGYLARWSSLFYSAGPSISLPIFEGGELRANLRLAKAKEKEAALHYRGSVLNALKEVEDGLVSYRTDQSERDRVADTVRSAESTFSLAQNQYAHGLASFIQVLDAQRTLLAGRQNLVQADAQLLSDVVSLYRALGGGWQATPADNLSGRSDAPMRTPENDQSAMAAAPAKGK